MKKSESIKELATALSDAQSQMKGAIKDATNPFYKSQYADLASVWECIREPMRQNGLSVTQITDFNEEGNPVLVTVLMHSSGEWISGRFPLLAKDNTPQAFGSCVSYARRYSLAAIMGVVQIDDDAEAAQLRPGVIIMPGKPLSTSINQPRASSDPLAPGGIFIEPRTTSSPTYNRMDKNSKITDKQVARLKAIAAKAHWSNEEIFKYIRVNHSFAHPSDITYDKYPEICSYIELNPKIEAK
jgi:hypothetical protein